MSIQEFLWNWDYKVYFVGLQNLVSEHVSPYKFQARTMMQFGLHDSCDISGKSIGFPSNDGIYDSIHLHNIT